MYSPEEKPPQREYCLVLLLPVTTTSVITKNNQATTTVMSWAAARKEKRPRATSARARGIFSLVNCDHGQNSKRPGRITIAGFFANLLTLEDYDDDDGPWAVDWRKWLARRELRKKAIFDFLQVRPHNPSQSDLGRPGQTRGVCHEKKFMHPQVN